MFENVGKHNDPEAAARATASTLLIVLACSVVTCATVGVSAYVMSRVAAADDPLEVPLDFQVAEVEDVQEDLTAPAPPPLRKGIAVTVTDIDPEPVAEEPVDEPAPLEEIDDRITDAPLLEGDPDGDPDGELDGTRIGIPEGTCKKGDPCDTRIGTPPGEAHKPLHNSEVSPVSTDLDYPDNLRTLGLDVVKCPVTVYVDTKGRPERVQIDDACPPSVREHTRAGLMRWRWRSEKEDGLRIPFKTRYVIVYKLP